MAAQRRSAQRRLNTRREYLGFTLFVLPAVLFFGLYKYWPIFYSAFLSFVKWNFVSAMKWVGWSNFTAGVQTVLVFLIGAWPAIGIGIVCGVVFYKVRHPRKKQPRKPEAK